MMIRLKLGGRSRLGILSMIKADEKSSSKVLGNLRGIFKHVRSDLQQLDM